MASAIALTIFLLGVKILFFIYEPYHADIQVRYIFLRLIVQSI